MNEFVLHERLIALESIANQYSEGKHLIPAIQKTRSQLSSRLYRVAVIGEFKRGKSSLVNAIIGAEVLPTDILPMTATVTRVTYGDKRNILIQYKDGRTEEQTIEQLMDYATKYDEEKEKIAATVQEILVYYPSVFCRNHIDILDTPGLNDNEQMTEVTLRVLGDVDAAIVVISATHPMSLTEQNLILDLIERKEIRHLVFAITHIDAIGRRVSEQDRMIQFIKDRISGEVLDSALEKFQEDDRLAKKAKQILQNPDLFGVSSVQAIEGFVQDDWELLEKSRFPHFKNELLALLTAAQNTDIADKVQELTDAVTENLDVWHNTDFAKLKEKEKNNHNCTDRLNQFYAEPDAVLTQLFADMDTVLSEAACTPETLGQTATAALTSLFVAQLASIREADNHHAAIKRVLELAQEEANAYAAQELWGNINRINEIVQQTAAAYEAIRLERGFSREAFAEELEKRRNIAPPALRWQTPLIPEAEDLKGLDIILHVEKAIEEAITDLKKALDCYISDWKTVLTTQNNQDAVDHTPLDNLDKSLKVIEDEIVYATRSHHINVSQLDAIRTPNTYERCSNEV